MSLFTTKPIEQLVLAWSQMQHHGEVKPLDQVAHDWALLRHRGETFKYMDGPLVEHPLSVANRQINVERYVEAVMHDTTENIVKEQLKKFGLYRDAEALVKTGELIGEAGLEIVKRRISKIEEPLIKLEFFKMKMYFASRGHDISPIIPKLDANTPRTTLGRLENFDVLMRFVDANDDKNLLAIKAADLEFNMHEKHNPPLDKQSMNTKRRQTDYRHELAVVYSKDPGLQLRDFVPYTPKVPSGETVTSKVEQTRPGLLRESLTSVMTLLA